jgi:ADP-ribose pyrophosphatase YjhB (NUDIX family)
MGPGKYTSFGHFFLKKHLHPPTPPGFRTSLILLIVNQNPSSHQGQYLFVRQSTKGKQAWGMPKEGLESKDLADDLTTALSRNLEEELGFRGPKVNQLNPSFRQVAFIFNISVQKYDLQRSAWEESRDRPVKGKIYHLAIMEYRGPDTIPLSSVSSPDGENIDKFQWVTADEGRAMIKASAESFYKSSADFNVALLGHVVDIYNHLATLLPSQPSLF